MELDHQLQIDSHAAEQRAIKRIAQMLQRPDQLEKVDQYEKGIARKRMGVESRLKTAVQSQLDGVRTGIDQLHLALQSVREVKRTMTSVEQMMNSAFQDQHIKEIKDISAEHRQLGAAMENLRQIFTVPESIDEIRTQLKAGDLLQAHKTLRELEMSRDELLYEQHKLENGSQGDITLLTRYFQDVDVVSGDMFRSVSHIITDCFKNAREKPSVLVSALRIVEREHMIDQEMERRKTYSGFCPPGRPKRWRENLLEILKNKTEDKIRLKSDVDRSQSTWLGKHLQHIKFQTVEELINVKHLIQACFPPTYNIFEKFTHWYHLAISNEIQRLIDSGLESNFIIEILIFTNNYMSEHFMGNPQLGLTKDKLPELLDPEQQNVLLKRYYETTKTTLNEWLAKSLALESSEWIKEEEPIGDEDGYFCTDLPIILYKMITEMLTVAKKISNELKDQVFGVIVDQMKLFGASYVRELNKFKLKHFEDRAWPMYYHHYMVASINNCHTLGENFLKIKEEFGVEHSAGGGADPFGQVSPIADEMEATANKGCEYLVEEVMLDLKPIMEKIMTKDEWLDSNGAGDGPVDTICVTVEDYSRDFAPLRPDFLLNLFMEIERQVTVEYIRQIMTKKMKFNPNEYENELERKQVAEQLISEAEQLSRFFKKLSNCRDSSASTCDAIRSIADLLKISSDMIELDLSSMVSRYSDLTAEHIRSLLTLRGDISSAEAKTVTESSLQQRKHSKNVQAVRIFADIQVQTGFFSR